MTTTFLNTSGTIQSVLTTELNSMANNALVLSSAITPTNQDYLRSEWELSIASMGGTPTANTAFVCWFLRALDGTNYSDGGTSVTPSRRPDFFFPIRAVSTAQILLARGILLPPGVWKVLIKNDATGQALASSANTLKVKAYTDFIA